MQKRQEEYAVHFKHEIEACREQHMAEVKRLKAALEASTKGQGSTFPRGLEVTTALSTEQPAARVAMLAEAGGMQVDKLALHYAQTEAFHAAQVSKLQSEADAHRAVGNVKEADVRLDYLQYHRAELEKTRAVLHLTKDKSMLLEDAVKALQVRQPGRARLTLAAALVSQPPRCACRPSTLWSWRRARRNMQKRCSRRGRPCRRNWARSWTGCARSWRLRRRGSTGALLLALLAAEGRREECGAAGRAG